MRGTKKLNLELDGIDWVIVGGESGPGARKMEEAWVIDIREQCADADVAFFFKQWGVNANRKQGGNWTDRLMTRCRNEHSPNPASCCVNLKFSVNRQRARLQKQIFSLTPVQDVRYENSGTSL